MRTVLSFLPAVNYSVGENPNSVAVGDFNHDGVPDLVATNTNEATLSVLLGNGDGTFQPAQDYLAGNLPTKVVTGDYNNDGSLDLVVASGASLGVSVIPGNGDGSFGRPRRFGVDPEGHGGLARLLAVGDFNGDGNLDLGAAIDGIFGVMVLLGNGDGTLQTGRSLQRTIGGVRGLEAADFNGDGLLDLVTIDAFHRQFGRAALSVYLGNGDGTFQADVATDLGQFDFSASVTVSDFNGDGLFDVLTTNSATGLLRVLFGTGDGAFQDGPSTRVELNGPFASLAGVLAADFNGDGVADVAFADTGVPKIFGKPGRTVGVLLGNGDGTFQAAEEFLVGEQPAALAVADLNGDGWLDLVAVNRLSHDLSVLLNDGVWGGAAPGGGASTGLLGLPATPAPVVAAPAVSEASSQGGAADWFFAPPREEDRTNASARNRRLVADLDLSLDQEFQRVSNPMF